MPLDLVWCCLPGAQRRQAPHKWMDSPTLKEKVLILCTPFINMCARVVFLYLNVNKNYIYGCADKCVFSL